MPSFHQAKNNTQRAEIALRFRALHWEARVMTAGPQPLAGAFTFRLS